MTYEVIWGDALKEMSALAARGITFDACIADPPYGTTSCAWDAVIPFAPMWANLKQLVKRDGAIVLFGSQPFTSALVMSNPKMFKYEWIWRKSRPGGFLNAKHRPLKAHENICVFSEGEAANGSENLMVYHPQGLEAAGTVQRNKHWHADGVIGQRPSRANRAEYVQEYTNYPSSVLDVASEDGMNRTVKPVELMRYLVRTYTNPGDTVLDFAAGSFTTGVACVIEGRNFIGIEQDEHYCAIGEARLKRASGEWAEKPRPIRRQIETPLFAEGVR